MNMTQMKIIARIKTPFDTKFGIPRQSGVAAQVRGEIVFEPPYRDTDAVRGLEGYSHIWLIWCFSESVTDKWSPTVRPPRLGGNARMGVFATRSPFRPNSLGLSCVKLLKVIYPESGGVILRVSGADLVDGTPIYDIKPFIPYADNHPDARGGFTNDTSGYTLAVTFPEHLLEQVPASHREALRGVLAHDPRPSYQHDPERVYGMEFAGMEIRFRVDGEQLIVCSVAPIA